MEKDEAPHHSTVSVAELGLDSLMAVEFGARVTRELGVEMVALQLGRNFSLEQVGPKAAERVVAAAGLVA
ncbi:acyl carrier protein [Nocardia vinacea]|uniref:acyl carrier protein n=1 Tax=Nocardia vinacea TaxID=96468 RepID=UPI00340A6DE5